MSETSTWSEAPGTLSLTTGEVHVWRIELDQPDRVLERFRKTLEADELDRAGRFHFEKHRRHFVAGRGFLRYVLARYLHVPPESLRFKYGAYGKPSLTGLQFNMSHSHNVGLVAVSEMKELGVDVEHIRADFATEDIARRFFSRAEVETFNTLATDEQVAAFFRCWTRKEAYIKAIGLGMSQPLDEFDVTLAPNDLPALLYAKEDDALRWHLSDLDVDHDYAAALIVEAPVSNIRLYQPRILTD